jgi:arylsulfatase A-like enzyme
MQPLLHFAAPRLQNPDIPWVAALFNLALFVLLGVIIATAKAAIPRFPGVLLATWICSSLILFDVATSMWMSSSKPGYWLALHHLTMLSLIGSMIGGFVFAVFVSRRGNFDFFCRRTVPLLVLLMVGYGAFVPASERIHERLLLSELPPAPTGTPNIIVIVVDALRADHLSMYGYARQTSPNLDRFAAEGVTFSNAIAPAPWTTPSHASLLTGLYPSEHRTQCLDCYLDGHFPTIAESFVARGYRTAAFSANEYNFCRRIGLGRGFIHFPDFHTLLTAVAQTRYGTALRSGLRDLGLTFVALEKPSAARINAEAFDWIAGDSRPFFVFINYMEVHDPYLPPSTFFHQYSTLPRPPRTISLLDDQSRYTPKFVQAQMDAYDAAISYWDSEFGDFQRELQRRGLDHNTVIVVLSDHGEGFYEHRLMGHANSLYRELLHVPLIFWEPGKVPSGIQIDQVVSTTELPATLLQLIENHKNDQFRGPSLTDLWIKSNGGQHWPDPLSEVAQMAVNPGFPNYDHALESITTPQWHYIFGGNTGSQLYEYASDPLETKNMTSTEIGKTTASVLQSELRLNLNARDSVMAPAQKATEAEHQKTDQMLRSLGYAN